MATSSSRPLPVLIVTLAVAVSGELAACSGDSETATASSTSPSSAPVAAVSTSPSATSSTEPTAPSPEAAEGPCAPASGRCVFGETYSYTTLDGSPTGVAVTVTPAGGYEPTYSEVFVDDWAEAVRYDVTIANDSDEPFDASLFYATVQSGGREGEEAFDHDAGLDGAPGTSIIPGNTVTFPIAYGVADPDDVVLELTPSMDYAEVLYTAP